MSTPALARAAEALKPHQDRATQRTSWGEKSIPMLTLTADAAARAAVSAALSDPIVTHALTLHQVESHGMGPSTPDGCACGERIMPAPHQSEYEDISSRRGRAFAEHQAAELLRAILGEEA